MLDYDRGSSVGAKAIRREDIITSLLSVTLVAGLFLDGWNPDRPRGVAGPATCSVPTLQKQGTDFRMTDFLTFAGVDPATRRAQKPTFV